MKIYSNNNVTLEDLANVADKVAHDVTDAVNTKQDRQIMQTRVAIGLVFVANLLIAIALRVL